MFKEKLPQRRQFKNICVLKLLAKEFSVFCYCFRPPGSRGLFKENLTQRRQSKNPWILKLPATEFAAFRDFENTPPPRHPPGSRGLFKENLKQRRQSKKYLGLKITSYGICWIL
jgi:hypothetical protein